MNSRQLVNLFFSIAFTVFWESSSSAQVVDTENVAPSPSSPTTEVFGIIAGGVTSLTEDTNLYFGVLYGDSTGPSLGGALAIVNANLSANWMLTSGYVFIEPKVPNAPNPNNNQFRLGLIYTKRYSKWTIDNRLLYEAVIADQGRENGNRVRNRLRGTYSIDAWLGPPARLFGYVEPIYDDRFDDIQLTNVTLGIGRNFGALSADLFITRLFRKQGTGGDTNGLTLQFFYKF